MKLHIGIIVAIFASFVALQATADGIKSEGILETAAAECLNLGGDARAIQMIRSDEHPELEQLLANLEVYIADEFPDGMKKQPLFISRIRAVGKWVYYHFPEDFDPELVGTTYTTECSDKTITQILNMFPQIAGEGSKESQKRGASKSWETQAE